MCKCKKIDLSELMDSNYTRTPCKSVNCCISKSKTICKKVDRCISNSSTICSKVDNCITHSKTICSKVDDCIANSATFCNKVYECIQTLAENKCKNPVFEFKCIPFPPGTDPAKIIVINLFGKHVTDTLNNYGITLFAAIESGDYSGLTVPSTMLLQFYDSNGVLLFASGVPSPLPPTCTSSTVEQYGLYLLAFGFQGNSSLSLTSENITMDNLFKASGQTPPSNMYVTFPTTTTTQDPSGSSTTTIGNVYATITSTA